MAIRVFPRYPHMGPEEAKIWHRFLAMNRERFIKIDYDVRVGTGYVPEWLEAEYKRKLKLYEQGLISKKDLELTESILKSTQSLTQLRIDVVAETDKEIWILEVKPRAGRSALGQLEAYHFWFLKQYKPRKRVRLGVVCYDVDKNLEPIFHSRGIAVFKVPR